MRLAQWSVVTLVAVTLPAAYWLRWERRVYRSSMSAPAVVQATAPQPKAATPAQRGVDATPALVDADGFNREGFDREGYDRHGLDSGGFDRSGRDLDGYDRAGRDRLGFDRHGLDRDGFDRMGFSLAGYNRGGFDRRGRRLTGALARQKSRARSNPTAGLAVGAAVPEKCAPASSPEFLSLQRRYDEAYRAFLAESRRVPRDPRSWQMAFSGYRMMTAQYVSLRAAIGL